jgi:hypothetical protein
MPAGQDTGSSGGDDAPKMSRWERIKYSVVRPDDEGDGAKASADERSVDEIRDHVRVADDRERAVGLIAGPISAVITFIVIGSLISRNSQPTTLAKNYVAASTYHWVLLVLLGLAVIMLASAWFRKRLILAVALALYGIGLFQLGYLGFAVPFVLAGAWYLVRGFRLQQELKQAEGEQPGSAGTKGTSRSNGARPRQNKRYTPPT